MTEDHREAEINEENREYRNELTFRDCRDIDERREKRPGGLVVITGSNENGDDKE